jgi:hypothetical protein|tara:strand:+ start:345 stop:845 length:501 start_codon:yes stop_codon:yes gene_type:complete
MKSLIAVPFLIGSLPLLGSVAIGYNYLKSKRESNKYLFWGGISGFAFAGWMASNMIMNRYTESLDFDAESFAADSEGCSECLFQDEGDDRDYIYGPMIYYYGSGGYRHIPNANFCYTCGAEIEKPQTGWAAESKFIRPYDRKGKIDFRRDNKGRYRRKLSIPLKKK